MRKVQVILEIQVPSDWDQDAISYFVCHQLRNDCEVIQIIESEETDNEN